MLDRKHSAVEKSSLYIQGLQVYFKVDESGNRIAHISSGSCRDDKNTFNMSSSGLVINLSKIGLNGFDKPRSNNTDQLYAVYLISDSSGNQKTGSISTSSINLNPIMPFGYDKKRLIGYLFSFSSGNSIQDSFTSGSGNYRKFLLSTPARSYSILESVGPVTFSDLTSYIPNVDNTPVHLFLDYQPSAAGNSCKVQGDIYYGQSDTFPYTNNITVQATRNLTETIGISAGSGNLGDLTTVCYLGFDFCV